jgi:hypothetical protein
MRLMRANSGPKLLAILSLSVMIPFSSFTAHVQSQSLYPIVKIADLNPNRGPAGTIVTIFGSGFAPVLQDNIVVFPDKSGGTRTAPVLTATSTSLTVRVPTEAASGRIYVQVGLGVSNGMRFRVVTPTNQAPEVNAGPGQTITLPNGSVLSGTVTDDGLPVGGTVTTTWSKLSGPGSVTFNDIHALSTLATFSLPGSYTLRLTATDTELTSTDDVVLTVNPQVATNQPPVVGAGPDQTITLPSGANLTGSATDDGLPTGALTTAWSVVNGPGAVTFTNPTALTTSAAFSVAGTYTLRFTASDSALSSGDDVIIIVQAAPVVNKAPEVTAGANQTITLPAGATLSGTATDDGLPTGTLITNWSKFSGPGTVTFGNAAALNSTATFSAAGNYVLQLTASDGVLSSSATVAIVAQAGTASYYVSGTNGNDSWSGKLADPNSANTDGPFRTLARAQSAMQASTIKTASIRSGTYSIQSSNLVFGWADTGETWNV